ncbi:Uncharacterized protein HZ326_25565 [Fusarium oxysporum f. sp. albedinis]|nr:Uncharacterized protein HZ326_25565 [Fusarium oxysporum f. sp. albedinis]
MDFWVPRFYPFNTSGLYCNNVRDPPYGDEIAVTPQVAVGISLCVWFPALQVPARFIRLVIKTPGVRPVCERLFSAAGRMVNPLRHQLEAQNIGMCQVLRSWLTAGIIHDFDPFLVSVDEEKVNIE